MRNDSKQSGFSLIEILIGMTIGLIVILVIMQTMSMFEGQRKTSTSAADMQGNGLLSLYSLEQDSRLAGYGLIVNPGGGGDLPCLKINGHANPAGVFDAIPISITTSGAVDVITISRLETTMGGLVTGGQAASISSVIATQADFTSAVGILLSGSSGIFKTANLPQTVGVYPSGAVDTSSFTYQTQSSVADSVLVSFASNVVAPSVCTLLQVNNFVATGAYVSEVRNVSGVPYFGTILTGASSVSAVVNGVRVSDAVASAIAPNGVISAVIPAWTRLTFAAASNVGLDTTKTPVFPIGGYPAGSAVMHNLGPNPTFARTTFTVNSLGQFTRQLNNAPAEVIANNIVSLQAQYGIAALGAAVNRQAIACWVNPTGANTNPAIANYCPAGDTADWTPAGLVSVPANLNRIKAIRVAIVARNGLREKADKATGQCTTTTTAPISWLNGPAIDLTANPDWKCYRYKVYQTIIPLHNVILGNI